MRRLAVLVLLLALSLPCTAQGGPELDALAEALFATDLKALLRHLPPEFEKAFAEASVQKQHTIAQRLMFLREIESEGVKFTRPESGPVVLIIEPPTRAQAVGEKPIEVLLDKRLSDGYETLLRFRPKTSDSDTFGRNKVATVWMRYVEGEWRVYELEAEGESIKLDDPDFLAKLTDGSTGRPTANEASAVGSLRTLNTAAITYASTYPEIGFPYSVASMAPDEADGESTPEHAGLIDPVLATGQKSGYLFTYERTAMEAYRIVARPVEFGVTGARNFFTDESGVIRFTTEDREPTVNDEPLQ